MSELLEAALRYAEVNSWPIFPVRDDKTPWIAGGFKSASRDPRIIKEWWRRYPEAGIGFAIPEGVLVVDVDPRNNGVLPTGLPHTRTSSTRSAGTHHFYATPAGLTFVGHAAPGVDLKAAGKGYVILPPSPGYRWSRTGPMVGLPERFVNEWRRSDWDPSATLPSVGPKYLPWERGTMYGERGLGFAVENLSTPLGGERNNALFRITRTVAKLVAEGELDPDYAYETLYKTAEGLGLESYEIVQTMKSASERS